MKFKSTILLIALSVGIIFAGVDLLKFTARSSGGNIILNWQTTSETNLRQYIIERKTYNGTFMDVSTVQPRDDKNYEFVDQTVFKTYDQLYIYRLKIVDNNGSVSYSSEIPVPHSNVSSVKRTWGSIKALFR
jgi:hypothetical protein